MVHWVWKISETLISFTRASLMIILQHSTWIITFTSRFNASSLSANRTNMFVIHQEPNWVACVALADHEVGRHWHSLYIVFHIANWSQSPQSRGLGAKTIQAVCHTIQYPVIEQLSAPDTSKTGRRFQQEHRCVGGFEGGAWAGLYKPVGADLSCTPLRQGRGLHHVLLRGKLESYLVGSMLNSQIDL